MRTYVPFLLSGCVAACASSPPAVRVDAVHGTVRAHDREVAGVVAQALEVAPQVRALLRSTRDDAIEVWVVDRPRDPDWTASALDDRIEVRPEALVQIEFVLAHELTHWYADHSPYAGLPVFVEEGLADLVALRATGTAALRRIENEGIGWVEVPRALFEGCAQVRSSYPRADRSAAARIASHAVSLLGLERLRELRERSVDPLAYLEAAGLSFSISPQGVLAAWVGGSRSWLRWIDTDGAVLLETELESRGVLDCEGPVPPGAKAWRFDVVSRTSRLEDGPVCED